LSLDLNDLSWALLLVHDFPSAKAVGNEAFVLDRSTPMALINVAHAEMFLGDREECLELHSRYRRTKIKSDGTTWDAAVRDHFNQLREAGLTSPLMTDVLSLLDHP
jgi:hypothetical protein